MRIVSRFSFMFASAFLLLTEGAGAQSTESLERARELADSEFPPNEEQPDLPARAGELLGEVNGHTGNLVEGATEQPVPSARTNSNDAVAAFAPSYYYLTGNGKVSLPSRNSSVCALHKVQGIMEKNSLVRVRYFDSNTQELGNLDGNASFSSSAACVPKSKFFNYSANPISKIFDTKFYFVEDGSTWYPEEWGNAAAMLTGIGGPFRDLWDKAWVWQEHKDAQNVVDINSEGTGYITAYSTAFWFNESSGPQKNIKFIGPGGTGTAAQAGEYFVGQHSLGAQSVQMASIDQAFCYLTGVNGELSQYADRVQIYVNWNTRRYMLQVNKSNSDAIHAYARCMAFDQR